MPDAVKVSFLEWLATEDQERQDGYNKYRDYYEGEHDAQLTDRQRRYLQIKDDQEFNVNLCPVVVDSLAERLTVTGFMAEKGQDEILWQWWTDNRMDGVQKNVHTAAIRDGDGYVMVGLDNEHGRPTFTHEPAFNGTDGVKIHYASEQRQVAVFASKRWRIESENGDDAGYRRRLNLYYPDRVEKYVSDQRAFEGNWVRYQEEGDNFWPIPWTDGSGQPLGVPIIHWRNQGRGYDYGRSELVDAIPVQNALNKSVIDLLSTADLMGFPLYYMLGDDPSALSIAPGAVIYSNKPANEVTFGKIPPSDLTPMSAIVDQFKITMAQVTRTPVSFFQISGHRPAEGTLKQEEAGLVAKAKDRQVYFGNSWEDAMMLARRLAGVYGEPMDETITISTQWADAETRNEREHLETLKIKKEALGIPLQRLWAEAGYDADEIAEMEESDEYAARLAMQRNAALMFSSGGNESDEDEDES